jgi:hypothetical protein
MNTTKGQRRGILATLISVLALLLVGVLLTVGAPRAAAQTTAASSSTSQALYMFADEGYVEVLVLDITGTTLSGSELADVYNCGNNQAHASSPIAVYGTVNGSGDVDLEFSGLSGTLVGTIGPDYLYLTAPGGGSEELQETSVAGLVATVLQDEPPVYSISGYTCSDLPATNAP